MILALEIGLKLRICFFFHFCWYFCEWFAILWLSPSFYSWLYILMYLCTHFWLRYLPFCVSHLCRRSFFVFSLCWKFMLLLRLNKNIQINYCLNALKMRSIHSLFEEMWTQKKNIFSRLFTLRVVCMRSVYSFVVVTNI